MKTKTITALDRAISDINTELEPRREDEFTTGEMLEKLKGVMSLATIQRRLKELCKSGAYSRRPMGRDFLFRKT